MTSESRKEAVRKMVWRLCLEPVAAKLDAGGRVSLRMLSALFRREINLKRRTRALLIETERELTDQNNAPSWFWQSFIIIVAVPVAASLFYFQFLVSDQFISEMRFAVRGTIESLPGSDALASSGMGTLASLNTNQDAFIVEDYIKSSAIIDDLSKEVDLYGILTLPKANLLARYYRSAASDDLLHYWRKAVNASVEVASGILTVKVKTYLSKDSVLLAKAVRARADAVINQLLDRMRGNMTALGEVEVRTAMTELVLRRSLLERFRNRRMSIDPLGSVYSLNETITELRRELIEINVKLASARNSLSSDALQIKMLESGDKIISAQIAGLEAKLTGAGANPFTASSALAEFDLLEVQKNLAEKRVELSERLLDNARTDARRQHLYLVSIEDPTEPEASLFPRRGDAIFMIFLGALGIWSVVAFTVAGVHDHTN